MIALAALGRPAAAQLTDVEANATINAGYNQQSQTAFVPDPNGQRSDITPSTTQRLFVEIRPGISIQRGSPRLTWRAGYIFAGMLNVVGDSLSAFSNAASGSLAAEVTPLTTVTLSTALAQGGTSFQLSSRPADSGQPELRAPGNPNQVSGSLAESLFNQLGKQLTLQQTLVASINAPQDSLDENNIAVAGSLAIARVYEKDTLGVELHGTVSWLRPLRLTESSYQAYTSSLQARWNRDFSPSWNASVSAGLEQVFTDTGSKPLAFLPAGSLSVRFTLREDIGGALDFSHGTASNLQVGSISLTDRLTVRGDIAIDSRVSRTIAFSAGVLHNEPLGQVAAAVAAGTGNALAADVGYTTVLAKNILGAARYSLAYQFDQGGNLPTTIAHVFYLGVSGSIKNSERPARPVPTIGHRVDGTDGQGFTVEPEPPPDAKPDARP